MEAGGRALAIALALSTLVAAVSPAIAQSGGSEDRRVPTLVGFRELPREALEDGRWANRTVAETLPALDVASVLVEDPDRFRREVIHRRNVVFVERDHPVVDPALEPDDPRYPEQDAPPQIQLQAAWDIGLGDRSVLAAVVDSGIRDDHEDLAGAVETQRDFAEGDAEAQDECGHGTHVAGILAARTDNGVGIAGTSDAGLIDAKVLQPDDQGRCVGWLSDVADAIRWSADQGARVVSLSLVSSSTSSTVNRSIAYAADAGAVLVAAAGNAGPCTDCVGYPASHPEVLAVSCTDDAETFCGFSSQGPEVEVSAPGRGILSTTVDGGYGWMTGTSMSTPFASGTVTLMLSADPDLSRSTVRSALHDTAQDLGPDGRDVRFGFGEVDAEQAMVEAADVNRAPAAAIGVDCRSLTCTFDGSASSDPDGDLLTYAWSLGDGTSAEGVLVEHTYEAAGVYTVALNVSDGALWDTTSTDVSVRVQASVEATPLEPAYGPDETPRIHVRVERLDTGASLADVPVHAQTRWTPGPHAGTAAGTVEDAILRHPFVVGPVRSADLVYHEATGRTDATGTAVLEIPDEAGSGLTLPTPAHRVRVDVQATVDGLRFHAATSYHVSALG